MTRLLLIVLCFVGLAGCASKPFPVTISAYETEQVALEIATREGTSAALDRFLTAYPNSVWTPTAIYRRDQAALEEAKQIGTPKAFQIFLQRYPKSDWADQARYFLRYGVPTDQTKG